MKQRCGNGGRRKIYATQAEKQAAYRKRNKIVNVTIQIPEEINEGLENYLKYRDETKSNVIAKLIKTQLLRKR